MNTDTLGAFIIEPGTYELKTAVENPKKEVSINKNWTRLKTWNAGMRFIVKNNDIYRNEIGFSTIERVGGGKYVLNNYDVERWNALIPHLCVVDKESMRAFLQRNGIKATAEMSGILWQLETLGKISRQEIIELRESYIKLKNAK